MNSFTLPAGTFIDERFFIKDHTGKIIYMFGWTGEFWADKDTVFAIELETRDADTEKTS